MRRTAATLGVVTRLFWRRCLAGTRMGMGMGMGDVVREADVKSGSPSALRAQVIPVRPGGATD